MLGYCRLTSLAWRKEPNNDSQAYYLHFSNIHSAGTDAEEAEAGFPSHDTNSGADRNPDPAGNASLIIEAG
jgi:hypothetical protein